MEDRPIIDPHSIACYLLEEAHLRIPESSLQEYWSFNAAHGEEWAQGVDPRTIPVGLYGDSAKVTTKFGQVTNLIGIYFNFILWQPQSVRLSRFLVFVLPEHECWKHYTMQVVLRRVTWSLNSLMNSRHPVQGPWDENLPQHLHVLGGKPIGSKFKVVEIRGDWQWHKRIWRFRKCNWNSIQVCYWCPAMSASTDESNLYWKYDHNSWDDQLFNTNQFIIERMPHTGICSSLLFGKHDFFLAQCVDFLWSMGNPLSDVILSIWPSMHACIHGCMLGVWQRSTSGPSRFSSVDGAMVLNACGSFRPSLRV